MSILNKIRVAAENVILRSTSSGRIMIEAASRMRSPSGSNLYNQLNQQAKTVQAQTIRMMANAISAATDPENPDRGPLAALIDNLMIDSHLASVIESRILFVQRSPFKMVDDAGKENTEISWLLERPWFEELIYRVLFSKFQGTTLIEMYDLTPDGELHQINEIPQAHFNAAKGLILKEPGDTNGWNYKEGIFANYYVQIGKDWDLGMLEKLAPIVLAKKLGLGSWLDYIEKFGIPPIFITTDREDPQRLEELFEAGKNFKSNGFMVGRGAEKFDVGNVGGAGVAPFDTLIDRANNEMSKRVLGGSGIADEKAFVGSAEIQFKLAKDRFESDKIFFKYVFNKLIKPRLIALSPVYAVLENHYLEWDNTESLNQQQTIEAVSKLGNIYDMDISKLAIATGLPITGIKQVSNFPPAGGKDEKK